MEARPTCEMKRASQASGFTAGCRLRRIKEDLQDKHGGEMAGNCGEEKHTTATRNCSTRFFGGLSFTRSTLLCGDIYRFNNCSTPLNGTSGEDHRRQLTRLW